MLGHRLALDAMLRHREWYDHHLDPLHDTDICASSYFCSPSTDQLGLPRPSLDRSLRFHTLRLQYSTLLDHGGVRHLSRRRDRAVSLVYALDDHFLTVDCLGGRPIK